MFDVELMVNHSPTNYVFKDVGGLLTARGELREETSIVNPEIMIQTDSIPYNVNYMHIHLFHRYYFVNDITSVREHLWRFSCTVDPLMSFSDQLMTCGGILAKGERNSNVNLMLDDGSFKVYSDPYIITRNFPGGFPGQSYVLALAGG